MTQPGAASRSRFPDPDRWHAACSVGLGRCEMWETMRGVLVRSAERGDAAARTWRACALDALTAEDGVGAKRRASQAVAFSAAAAEIDAARAGERAKGPQ